MAQMIASRLIQGIVVIIGVTLIVFLTSYMTGDPASLMLGEFATDTQIQAFTEAYGLDRPVMVQYWEFLTNAVRGDFGNSLHYKTSNLELVKERLPSTLKLAGISMLGALVFSIPLGIYSARHHNTWKDTAIMACGVAGQSIPNFWLALLMIMHFGVELGWLPVSGMNTWKSYVMPSVTLMMWPLAQNIRMMRSSMLEVLDEEYTKLARAKGLHERVVIWKHALKNAIRPVLTQVGLQLGSFLGGAVITETIFAWPGIGRLAVQAIQVHDFPLLRTVAAMVALGFVVINLTVDVLYAVIDPRVR
ncbi:MAG TPA: ABC transporter permease [Firmicutes bacterium]|nr:ABC transporter permease [Bacillota bacterium]